jgi:hypothetical protein
MTSHTGVFCDKVAQIVQPCATPASNSQFRVKKVLPRVANFVEMKFRLLQAALRGIGDDTEIAYSQPRDKLEAHNRTFILAKVV